MSSEGKQVKAGRLLTVLAVCGASALVGSVPVAGSSTHPGWAGLALLEGENPVVCSVPRGVLDPPEYYAFPLVNTKRIPGTGRATGTGRITFADSPFGIAVVPDGSYLFDLWLSFENLKAPVQGEFVVWVTTPDLDQIQLLGTLDESLELRGRVRWNKFLVVITLEPRFDESATIWQGPIVLRGMSRSGMMHTMAGHGPFEQENCATFGYN